MRLALTLAAAQLRADLRHAQSGRRSAGRVATTAIAYGFSGLVLALSLGGAPPDQVVFVAASFGIVLAAFGVVGSYDELMGRPKENAWLATLPATEAEHYASRLLGIGAYVALMALSLAAPPAFRTGLTHGPVAAAAVAVGVAGAVVWTSAASLASLWSLTLALPQRALRRALAATRTVLIAALVLGFQLIGTSTESLDAPWWPAAWMADALAGRSTVGLAGLVASLLTMGVLFAAVFPDRYFGLLHRLASGARQEESEGRSGRGLSRIEQVVARTGPVRAAYGFAVAAFADDRLVRGRLWPAALLPAGFVVFGWIGGGLESLLVYGSGSVLTSPDTQLHLSVVVVLLFCAQSLVQTLQFSDHAEASWVFGTLPEARPRLAQLGAQRALVVRVLLPLHVGLGALLALWMPPADAALHALFWFALTVLATLIQALCYRTPPFSRRGDRFNAAARFVPLVVSLPAGVAVLFLQMWAFVSPLRALAASAALLGVALVVGAAAARLLRRPRRVAAPASEVPVLDAA